MGVIRTILWGLGYTVLLGAIFGMVGWQLAMGGWYKLGAVGVACGLLVTVIMWIDETMQGRRKWRDAPGRRHPIIKDWNE